MDDEHDIPWLPALARVWDEMDDGQRDAYLDVEGEQPPPEVREAVKEMYRDHDQGV